MSLYNEKILNLFGNIPQMNILVGLAGYNPDSIKQLCKQNGIIDYLDFFSVLPQMYSSWNRNQHHWTTRFVWRTVLPKIMEFLGVSSYEDDFEEIECFSDGNDITYHNWKHDTPFKFICIDDRYELTGDFSILRDITTKQVNDSAFTDYHRLFVGAHRNCIIKNEKPSTNIRLFVNADSMTIPIIPLIVPFVQEIFIYDSHKSSIDRQIILDFKSTHYIMCNTVMNLYNGNIMRKIIL